MRAEPTILFLKKLHLINKQTAIDYCLNNKELILKSGKSEDAFNKIIDKLQNFMMEAADLPDQGIHDRRIGITHPIHYKSEVFTFKQLETLSRGLGLTWGLNPVSRENSYLSGSPVKELDDLVEKGLCHKYGWTKYDLNPSKTPCLLTL